MGYTYDVRPLDEVYTDDLIDALTARGFIVSGFEYRHKFYDLACEIWQLRRTQKDYQEKLEYMLSEITGKVV